MTMRSDDDQGDMRSASEAASTEVPPSIVRCPNCAIDLPVGRADESVGELACPSCGVRVPIVPTLGA